MSYMLRLDGSINNFRGLELRRSAGTIDDDLTRSLFVGSSFTDVAVPEPTGALAAAGLVLGLCRRK